MEGQASAHLVQCGCVLFPDGQLFHVCHLVGTGTDRLMGQQEATVSTACSILHSAFSAQQPQGSTAPTFLGVTVAVLPTVLLTVLPTVLLPVLLTPLCLPSYDPCSVCSSTLMAAPRPPSCPVPTGCRSSTFQSFRAFSQSWVRRSGYPTDSPSQAPLCRAVLPPNLPSSAGLMSGLWFTFGWSAILHCSLG